MRRVLLVVIACAACGSSTRPGGQNDAHGSGDGNGGGGDGSGGPPGSTSIYAHDANTLYRVDPDTYAVTMVGTFDFGAFEQMTDLGIDANGNLIGVTFFSVYKVDPTTAHCTNLSSSL